MKWFVCILLMIIAILIVICYALMVAASDADDRAEKMRKEWEDKHGNTDCQWK